MGYIMLQCHWGQCWQVKAIPHFTRCNHELYPSHPPLHHSHPPFMSLCYQHCRQQQLLCSCTPLYLLWSCSADLCGVGRLNIQSQSTELWTIRQMCQPLCWWQIAAECFAPPEIWPETLIVSWFMTLARDSVTRHPDNRRDGEPDI